MRYTGVALPVASAVALAGCQDDAPTAPAAVTRSTLAKAPASAQIDVDALLSRTANIVAAVNQRLGARHSRGGPDPNQPLILHRDGRLFSLEAS